MKIITVNSAADSFGLIADSAINLPGRPVFLPDIPEVPAWNATFYLAVRISRLGKTIREKFAPRYFDRLSLAMRLLPVDAEGKAIDAIAAVSDFALTLGEWTDIPEGNFSVTANGHTMEVAGAGALICRAIERLSRITTLKIGDILLLPLDIPAGEVSIGDSFEGSVGGEPLLNCRIR